MAKATSIPVLDNSDRVISKTTSAKARILVKKGKASIFSVDPFMIKMMDNITKENVMEGYFDFFEYFKSERPIFAQNVSNTVISFGFKTNSGQEFPVQIPNTPKPFCFTDYVSFEMLKESLDLRKMVNKEPKVIKLLSKEDFLKYYQNMADANGTTIDEELAKGRRSHAGIVDRNKLYDMPKETPKVMPQMAENKVEVEEQPSPKIIGLCSRVSAELEENERMPEEDFVERVMALPDLTEADLDYLQSKGHYKKIKSWAASKLEKLVVSKKSSK